MSLAGQAERIGTKRNACSVLVAKSKEKNQKEGLKVDERILL
jgi:hypothetical protein